MARCRNPSSGIPPTRVVQRDPSHIYLFSAVPHRAEEQSAGLSQTPQFKKYSEISSAARPEEKTQTNCIKCCTFTSHHHTEYECVHYSYR